ncbi:class I SAM-dependent methyltransferase [Orrella sp. JC864]|uniref:SAM-dependent methyltransferase n=1 Tax=Orrella sp. JC864 TaxID=3120298 RepID=UPI0030090BA9
MPAATRRPAFAPPAHALPARARLNGRPPVRLPWLAAFLAAASAFFAAGTCMAGTHAALADYEPRIGQPGKDLVWVPTAGALVEKMLDLAQATPADYLIDLGSGDGRTVIAAARRGLRAHGIEYNPELVALARRNAEQAGVAGRATFAQGDIFESDYSQAQVITLFLLPTLNERLRADILALAPGTRVVSNSFPMFDWEPDETALANGDCQTYCEALLWIVPARVQGDWRLDGAPLRLTQRFQFLDGSLGEHEIEAGRLRGREISFVADGIRYTGTVEDNAMHGTAAGAAGTRGWRAYRAGAAAP